MSIQAKKTHKSSSYISQKEQALDASPLQIHLRKKLVIFSQFKRDSSSIGLKITPLDLASPSKQLSMNQSIILASKKMRHDIPIQLLCYFSLLNPSFAQKIHFIDFEFIEKNSSLSPQEDPYFFAIDEIRSAETLSQKLTYFIKHFLSDDESPYRIKAEKPTLNINQEFFLHLRITIEQLILQASFFACHRDYEKHIFTQLNANTPQLLSELFQMLQPYDPPLMESIMHWLPKSQETSLVANKITERKKSSVSFEQRPRVFNLEGV